MRCRQFGLRRCWKLCLGILFLAGAAGRLTAADTPGSDITQALEAIRRVDHEGAGHVEARAAVERLSAADGHVLTPILRAMQGANPLAANWLRGAFEGAAGACLTTPEGLPVSDLLTFVQDRSEDPRARRLAYEWALRVRPEIADEIIPLSLDDPSIEMRRDAVAQLIQQAEEAAGKGDRRDAVELYRRALTGAGDPQQVDPIVKALEQVDEHVDLVRHYGLVTEWHVIGPFDNRELKGFATVYPPEEEINLDATYAGQLGPVQWERKSSDDAKGTFDLAALTAPHKGAVDYATTVFVSGEERPVEFRIATQNAWKLWLNGELLFAREEYHRGMRFDQYRVAGTLRAGENRLLLKVCQNEQEEEWAQSWRFQFRVCDIYGRALHSGTGKPNARESAPVAR